jgi:5,10-methylenetetrahydrofolate reductase
MRLRDKILKEQCPVVIYEIIPPRIVDGTIESYAERISSLLSQTHIDAINIPEVHAEESRGLRPIEERVRAKPREFARIIQDAVGIDTIVNRVSVHHNYETQKEWFRTTRDEFGIENFVIVGGESSKTDYPGPGVNETATMIGDINSKDDSNIFFGGISLPSRSFESKRMLSKIQSGVDFFTTQVLYDSDNVIKMLGHYVEACELGGLGPKKVLLSFAPISTIKNIDFLKWLGVEIPRTTEEYLVEDIGLIKERSIEVSIRILDEILSYLTDSGIRAPIGLNIEHVMSYNFQHSVELLQKMSMKYRKFCFDANIKQL